MTNHPANSRCISGSLSFVLALVVLSGCSGSPDIEELPPQTLTPIPSTDLHEPPVVASKEGVSALDLVEDEPTEAERVEKTRDKTLIDISSDPEVEAAADFRTRLLAASRRETARRRYAEAPVVVINDKNLSEMAEGGNLTIATAPEPPAAAPTRSNGDASRLLEADLQQLTPEEQEEVYWRKRARQLRLDWRNAHDSIAELESRDAELRTRFYAEDDPFVRDGRIKPAWDRVLDLLSEARSAVRSNQAELASFLSEGRRAGALPGWLREGKELEPRTAAEPTGTGATADAMEPKIYGTPP